MTDPGITIIVVDDTPDPMTEDEWTALLEEADNG